MISGLSIITESPSNELPSNAFAVFTPVTVKDLIVTSIKKSGIFSTDSFLARLVSGMIRMFFIDAFPVASLKESESYWTVYKLSVCCATFADRLFSIILYLNFCQITAPITMSSKIAARMNNNFLDNLFIQQNAFVACKSSTNLIKTKTRIKLRGVILKRYWIK